MLCRPRRVLVDAARSAIFLSLTLRTLDWKGWCSITLFYRVTLFKSPQLRKFCRCSQYGEADGSVNYVPQSHGGARCVMHAQAASAELGNADWVVGSWQSYCLGLPLQSVESRRFCKIREVWHRQQRIICDFYSCMISTHTLFIQGYFKRNSQIAL
jgi:hypothetical protein